MTETRCNHCGFDVPAGLDKCPNCGTSRTPKVDDPSVKRFLLVFVIIVVFALAMVLVLPR